MPSHRLQERNVISDVQNCAGGHSSQTSVVFGSATRPKEYKAVKLTVVVGDQDVVLDDVLVAPLKPGEKNFDFVF